ncbi:hypothetical protein [Streptomyces lydicus]|uniref:hypothetical protein n=1 Tax=Streptomyces lydicus TaxID=47763 RepID=UPI0036E48661
MRPRRSPPPPAGVGELLRHPELYAVGAALFRAALTGVLGERTASGAWSEADARRVGAMITAENARRVYRLPAAGAPVGED